MSITENGLLVVLKSGPYVHQHKLIVEPSNILDGLLAALNLQLTHSTRHQLQKVFNRYFFALNSSTAIQSINQQCHICQSLKTLLNEVHQQSSTPSSECPGQHFFADVLRHTKRKIFITRDVFSSFTKGATIPDKTADSLQSALIKITSILHIPTSTVRVNGAIDFCALDPDPTLPQKGITLDYGHLKNKYKNAVVDKGIQELQQELFRLEFSSKEITKTILHPILESLNS